VCRAAQADLAEAVLAVRRWEELQRACEHRHRDRERRFRRRAYERARDRALIALAMHSSELAPARVRRADSRHLSQA
jgi:hypothetical protein